RDPSMERAIIAMPASESTKVALVVFFCFVVGWTAMSALNAIVGGILGAIGGLIPLPQSEIPVNSTKPWHNAVWRALLSKYLGEAAPENIPPFFQSTCDAELAFNEQVYTATQLAQKNHETKMKKNAADRNDIDWCTWYRYFHQRSLKRATASQQVTNAVIPAFQAASAILLIAKPFTLQLQHWWVTAACVFWLSVLFAQVFTVVFNYRNAWQSFSPQLDVLQDILNRGQSFPEI
ncbi:MAG: hypothetical protein ACRD3Q_20930, partial [Terriglobales bacterium]